MQKHAGDVPVSVQVQVQGAELQLRIQGQGAGFDLNAIDTAEHLGLLSMQERASATGAVCKCISQPGKGTTIEACLIA